MSRMIVTKLHVVSVPRPGASKSRWSAARDRALFRVVRTAPRHELLDEGTNGQPFGLKRDGWDGVTIHARSSRAPFLDRSQND